MPGFSAIEETLFVPMLGRIYASEKFPNILQDKKAMEIKGKLPPKIKGQDTQTQYTLIASAVRSANMDRYIADFIKRNPDGIIVELGCGLETAFYRNHNGKTLWYAVDLPDVIAYRKELFGPQERNQTIAADAFGEEWIQQIRGENPTAPLLVTASGLFYYFEEEKVMGLFRTLKKYDAIEIVFDAVNGKGMKRMSKYMRQVGHADAAMYFYVDNGRDIAQNVGAKLLTEEPYYAHTETHGLQLITTVAIKMSDFFSMVKMLHIQVSPRK